MTLTFAVALAGCVAAMTLIASGANASTSYSHSGEFGGAGAGPGLFNQTTMPQRMAVHEESGKVFVVDRGNNRVQVFDPVPGGATFGFQLAVPAPLGIAVDQSAGDLYVTGTAVAGVNEVQPVQIQNATSGTYTLTFDGETIDPIAYNATAATVQTALRALPSINGANVNVGGAAGTDALRTRTVTFVGALAATDVAQITVDGSGLNGEASIAASTTTQGVPAIPAQVRKFNPDDADDPTAYTPDAGFTSPTVGAGPGQVGSFQNGLANAPNGGGIAVDPTTGDLIVADVGRNLIQRFDSDGDHLDDFNGCAPEIIPGSCAGTVRPAFTGIRDVAVTPAGDIVVADVSGTLARVDRYNGAGVHQAALSVANNPVPGFVGAPTGVQNSIVVEAHPTTGEVFVSSKSGTLFAPQPARVYQFEDDVHVADYGLPPDRFDGFIFDIVAHGSTRLYVLATNVTLGVGVPRVQVFDAANPALVSIDPIDQDAVTGNEATFSGTVTPQGTPTSWRFEYRPVGSSTWLRVPDPAVAIGSDPTPVAVEATATDLEPNSDYEVRLVAAALTVETISDTETFTVDPAPPVAITDDAPLVDGDAAVLRGRVNPRNAATTYQFEYGTTPAYGSVSPVAPAGSGGDLATVIRSIQGLQPSTTYHVRIVATNEFDQATAGDDQTFTTQPTVAAARAFEVVSHVPTGGIEVTDPHAALGPRFEGGVPSADGERFLYRTRNPNHYPGFELPHTSYVAERDPVHGWRTAGGDLPAPAGGTPAVTGIFRAGNAFGSRNLTRIVGETLGSFDPDDQNSPGIEHIFPNDVYMHDGSGGLTWVGRYEGALTTWVSRDPRVPVGTPQTAGGAASPAGSPPASSMAADGSVVVFSSSRPLLDEHSGGGNHLYKWSNGALTYVQVGPDGEPLTGTSLLGSATSSYSPNAVSRDGSRVIFTNAGTIYVQIDGRPTVEVGAGDYGGAAADGSRVVYTAGGRVFAFDATSETGRDLTGAPGVLGVSGVSDDGRRVYFVSSSVLDAGESPTGASPIAAGRNLYVAELDDIDAEVELRFVASLGAATTAADLFVWSGFWNQRTADLSSDGSVFAFGSVVSLTGEPTGGTRQLYVYDAGAGALDCASCPVDRSPTAGPVNKSPVGTGTTGGWQSAVGARNWVTDNGTVFFDTPTALLPTDRNTTRDVYEYRRGFLRKVSAGPSNAQFAGASVDGRTVFFTTGAALAPQDGEPGIRKMYAARVGGGFALSTKPACVGDECQGPPPAAPQADSAVSSSVAGRGNAANGVRKVLALRVPTMAQRRRAGRSGVLAMRVRSSRAGVVRVGARARIRGRGRSVGQVSRRFGRAGVQTVRLRLSPAARRALRSGRPLRVVLQVRSPGARALTATMVIRQGRRS